MDAGKNKQPYNLSSALGMSLKTTEAHGSHLWRNPFMEKPIYGETHLWAIYCQKRYRF